MRTSGGRAIGNGMQEMTTQEFMSKRALSPINVLQGIPALRVVEHGVEFHPECEKFKVIMADDSHALAVARPSPWERQRRRHEITDSGQPSPLHTDFLARILRLRFQQGLWHDLVTN
eukprot:4418160-Karenia_brevis.AAC.1